MHDDLKAAINKLNEALVHLDHCLSLGPQRHTPSLEMVETSLKENKELLIEIHNERKTK